MKQSDIFTLILIAGIGTLAAFFVSRAILGDPDMAKVEYKTVSRVIDSKLAQPDPEVFNSLAINPTIEVFVGNCEDIDQNGILDAAELVACGREEASMVSTEMTVEELTALREGEGCVMNTSGMAICGDEKRAYIDSLLQEMAGQAEQPQDGE